MTSKKFGPPWEPINNPKLLTEKAESAVEQFRATVSQSCNNAPRIPNPAAPWDGTTRCGFCGADHP